MQENLPQDNKKALDTAAVKNVRHKKRHLLVIVIIVIVCLLLGYASAQAINFFTSPKSQQSTTQRQMVANDGNTSVSKDEEDVASVAEKVSPSVVSIVTKTKGFNAFYGSSEQSGAGTGIIVGANGIVLTNKHVVDGVNGVEVIRNDGTTYEKVEILGSDPLNDVAFLRIPGVNDLPVAELGESGSVRVGQKVIAIGNSLGQYQNTVTSGIISGTGRPIAAQSGESVENLTDLLQTDAAINPGNSGGPLLNMAGQVIGVNTAIVEGAQGIGFAIPINSAKGMLKGILAGKRVERAYLGVNIVSITPDAAKYYNLPVKKGGYVFANRGQSAVVSNGPADKAGIQDKDIITKVGDIEVGDKGGVSSLIAEYAPGDTVAVTILRGGKELNLTVTLAAYTGN